MAEPSTQVSEAGTEAAGVRARGGGAGGAVRRGALRARQGPRRPAPPRRRRRRLGSQGRRRPRPRPLPRPPPRPPRLRRPQGGRRGGGAGQAPPVAGQGRFSQGVPRGAGRPGAGQGDRQRGAAVGRDGRGARRVRQGGAGGQGGVREDRAGGQGPVRAVRAGGGAPGRLRLALAEQAAAVPAGGADRRAHRRLLVREVQQGDRLRSAARAPRRTVPPGHPRRAHRQGLRGRVVGVQAYGARRDRRGRVVVVGVGVGGQACGTERDRGGARAGGGQAYGSRGPDLAYGSRVIK